MIWVDSSLQLYTTIISWQYYGLIWSLLVGSGLVFVPIVMALVSQLLDARNNGSMVGNDSDRLLSGIEVRIAQLFIIMFFVAMPASPFELNSQSVRVASKDHLNTPPGQVAEGSCNATNTSFDELESSDGQAICDKQAKIPIWWYGVLRVSHAITQAAVDELTSDTNQGFRALVAFGRSGKIVNQDLQNSVNLFETECYRKALTMNADATSGSYNGEVSPIDGGIFGNDVSWHGSLFLRDNFYGNITTDSPVGDLPFNPELNPGVDTSIDTPLAGRVNCGEWWTWISTEVFNEATSPEAGDNRAGRFQRLAGGFNFFGPNGTQDFVVRNYIQNSNPVGSVMADRANTLRTRGNGMVQNTGEAVRTLYQTAELAKISIMMTFFTDAVVKALPILQSYILMFIVFMLPFGFVLSGYSWGFVINASVLVFFVIFWSALWGFAAWIDDSMARALWPGTGDGLASGVQSFIGVGTEQSTAQSTNKLIHSIVTTGTYIGAPSFAAWVLTSAGFSVTNWAGSGAASGGAVGSAGGTSFVSGANKQIAQVKNIGNRKK